MISLLQQVTEGQLIKKEHGVHAPTLRAIMVLPAEQGCVMSGAGGIKVNMKPARGPRGAASG
jgi:hypothetical protein